MKSSFVRKALTSLVLVSIIFSQLALLKKDCVADSNDPIAVNLPVSREEFINTARSFLGTTGLEFRSIDGCTDLGFNDGSGWCAEFVSFCWGADVTGMPNMNRSVEGIVNRYSSAGRFTPVECEVSGRSVTYHVVDDNNKKTSSTYMPEVGDLVVYDENWEHFFEDNGAGEIAINDDDQLSVISKDEDWNDRSYNHIGIVSYVNEQTGAIQTIEGNSIFWRPRGLTFEGGFIGTKDLYIASGDVNTSGDYIPWNGYNYTNAALDYNDAASKFSGENRKVNEYSTANVKYCFITGFCKPNFASQNTFSSIKQALSAARVNNYKDIHFIAPGKALLIQNDVEVTMVYRTTPADVNFLGKYNMVGCKQYDLFAICKFSNNLYPVFIEKGTYITTLADLFTYIKEKGSFSKVDTNPSAPRPGPGTESSTGVVSDEPIIQVQLGDTSTSATEQPVVQDTPTSVPTVSVTPTPQVPTTQVPTTPSTPTPPPMRYPTHLPGIEHMGTRDRMEGDLLGDVNVDGVLDWNDMCYLSPIITLRWANDAALLEEVDAFYGHTVVDVNDDGMINADDSMWMINILSDQNRDRALAEEAAMRNEI